MILIASNPCKWIEGLAQETCRDNGHYVQFGLGSALHAAEVAWHQGVDVYTENQERGQETCAEPKSSPVRRLIASVTDPQIEIENEVLG